jgi:hypothetical protein
MDQDVSVPMPDALGGCEFATAYDWGWRKKLPVNARHSHQAILRILPARHNNLRLLSQRDARYYLPQLAMPPTAA